MVPTVSFVGRSSSGKTTLLETVIRELKLRGHRVGVIKHTHHDFDMDRPGKDSWRFAQAGSDMVAVSSPHRLALIERVDTESSLAELAARFEGKVDILITEGYKNGDADKIMVMGADGDVPRCEGTPLATVSARLSPLGFPEFNGDDVSRVTNLLEERIAQSVSSGEAASHHTLIPRFSELEELFEESGAVRSHGAWR